MVTSAQYCAMLQEEFKPTIHSKCRGILTDGIVLHHDNTQPHMAAVTIETNQKLKLKPLSHPAYSPFLASSDYRIFGLFIDMLCIYQFAYSEEINDKSAYMALNTIENILHR
jgi:hypothetical protein